MKNSNYTYTLKRKGMPIRKGGNHMGYGDLIIKFNISLDLNNKVKETINLS